MAPGPIAHHFRGSDCHVADLCPLRPTEGQEGRDIRRPLLGPGRGSDRNVGRRGTVGQEDSRIRAIEGIDGGTIQFEEGQIQESQEIRRERNLEVWSNQLIVDLHGRPMEDTGWFYHEFIEPADVAEGGGMSVHRSRGEAMLMTRPGYPGENPFGEDWLRLFEMLLPAFRAAVHHLQRRQIRGELLLRTLDALPRPVWLMDTSGTELYRNAALRELLESEPDAGKLVAGAAGRARAAGRLRGPIRKSHPERVLAAGERVLGLAGGDYRVRALYLESTFTGRFAWQTMRADHGSRWRLRPCW